MCGIALIVDQSNAGDSSTIDRMIDAIAHRGPDSRGSALTTGCSLGHARLQIIDLATGAQPLISEDRRYWITFNGEIYNYRDVREELVKRGEHFRTQSDTEVIVKAYAT